MTQQTITVDDIFALFRESEAERKAMQQALQQFQQAQQQSIEEHRRTVEREMAELRKVVADTNKKVGAISNRWGEFVENLVQPAAVRLLQAKGIQVHWTALNVVPEDRAIEIDILAENDTEIVAIEVKSFLEARDVKRFIKTLTKFKTVFPKYSKHKLYGAMAGIKVGTRAECDVVEAGLFLIKPAGDSVTIVNNEHFQPNIW